MELSSVRMEVLFFLMSFPATPAGAHSVQYLYTAITPPTGFPQFTAVGLVDGEQFVYYDNSVSKMIPRTAWIQKIRDDDPDHWEKQSQEMQSDQEKLTQLLAAVTIDFNHTNGVHTLQRMFGCELDDDGTTRGYDQYGYDGEDFINLDLKTLTWTAANDKAAITKEKWESTGAEAQHTKSSLEKECIEWLRKSVPYGRESLERKVRPEALVFEDYSSFQTAVCHATGFYPKALNITWKKDGEDVIEGVELGETLPNQDGSFQKRSILTPTDMFPEEHDYTCVVEHSSLEKELVLPVEMIGFRYDCYFPLDEISDGGSGGGTIDGGSGGGTIAVVCAVVALAASVAGILIWKKNTIHGGRWKEK
ncbi:major histocompatibility complex class I-related gene protein-like isoform X2 [Neoarius graeffei]|uniref:major histocompatibility complex class I-related gene protein-like isoform X2 n=1 Tax=Neoarius graeffei TaxID=443677 RepID=UPI00298C4C73|nr:major histocompatibility complex class I-related gene protein-like isoform X2 [Neoarius graeffei]